MPLSPQQFSQPHLPGFNVKPTDEHRWPRGFSPERKHEVDEALGRNAQGYHARVLTPNTIEGRTGQGHEGAFIGHINPNVEHSWMGREEGSKRVVETLARSTMPVEDMKGVTIHSEYESRQPRNTERGGYYSDKSNINGKPEITIVARPTDTPATKQMTKSVAAGRREMRQGDEQTLIHEFGHHVSAVAGTQHSVAYGGSSTARGKEEAFADDYRSVHYRPDPRDARRGDFEPAGYDRGGKTPRDPYADDDDPDVYNDQQHFAAAYRQQRKHPNVKPPHQYAPQPNQVGTYPSGVPRLKSDPDIEGQRRLFMRKEKTNEDTDPDYGQWPLYTGGYPDPEVDLPTITLGRGVPERYRR